MTPIMMPIAIDALTHPPRPCQVRRWPRERSRRPLGKSSGCVRAPKPSPEPRESPRRSRTLSSRIQAGDPVAQSDRRSSRAQGRSKRRRRLIIVHRLQAHNRTSDGQADRHLQSYGRQRSSRAECRCAADRSLRFTTPHVLLFSPSGRTPLTYPCPRKYCPEEIGKCH